MLEDTKKVYSYDVEGYFLWEVLLDSSDKCQITGDWLIPAYMTEKEPLLIKEGYDIKFINNNWEYIKIITNNEKKVLGELPLEEGELIVDGLLKKIEKPSYYYIWNYQLFSWDYDFNIRKEEIYKELDSIDIQTIRPLRAKLTGLFTGQDEQKLLDLEKKASELRKELMNISA